MNKIKITSSNNNHVIKDGVLFAKPVGATPMVGKDNRMFLVYNLGFKLNIPLGMIALIMPPNEASKYSVSQSGNFVLLPGDHSNVTIEYKINTDAVPRVFEQDEFCAQIVFVSTSTIDFETVLEEAKKEESQDMAAKVIDAPSEPEYIFESAISSGDENNDNTADAEGVS